MGTKRNTLPPASRGWRAHPGVVPRSSGSCESTRRRYLPGARAARVSKAPSSRKPGWPDEFSGAVLKDTPFLKGWAGTLVFVEGCVSQSTQHHGDLPGWKLRSRSQQDGQQEPRAAELRTDAAPRFPTPACSCALASRNQPPKVSQMTLATCLLFSQPWHSPTQMRSPETKFMGKGRCCRYCRFR